jgi:hypothetical protein
LEEYNNVNYSILKGAVLPQCELPHPMKVWGFVGIIKNPAIKQGLSITS